MVYQGALTQSERKVRKKTFQNPKKKKENRRKRKVYTLWVAEWKCVLNTTEKKEEKLYNHKRGKSSHYFMGSKNGKAIQCYRCFESVNIKKTDNLLSFPFP